MKYKLYHNQQHIGWIEQKDEDFPNLFGKYLLLPSILEKHDLLSRYIEYSIEANILLEEDELKWEMFAEKEEEKYVELIESEQWEMEDENHLIHKILVPQFLDNNEVIWRWTIN